MIYGPHWSTGAPAVGAAGAGQGGSLGPGWSADVDGSEADGRFDGVADAYAAYVRHLQGCGECGPARCARGQELVAAYLGEVHRRR